MSMKSTLSERLKREERNSIFPTKYLAEQPAFARLSKHASRVSTRARDLRDDKWAAIKDWREAKRVAEKKKRWFWHSIKLWRHGPWVLSGLIFLICNMGIIMTGALVFQDCPEIVMMWANSVAMGLLQVPPSLPFPCHLPPTSPPLALPLAPPLFHHPFTYPSPHRVGSSSTRW